MMSNGSNRRRTACEECRMPHSPQSARSKKLKCTGEYPVCSRCHRLSATCFYSLQKTMGRPKKQRQDFEPLNSSNELSPPQAMQPPAQVSGEAPLHVHSHTHAATDLQVHSHTHAVTDQPFDPSDWMVDDFDHQHLLYPGQLEATEAPTLHQPPSNAASWHVPLHEPLANQLLDPLPEPMSSVNNTSTQPQPCACLSEIYLALDKLRSMQDFSFPYSLHVLQNAINTGWNLVRCEHCPKLFLTATQNVQLLGLLMVSLSERYSKVLNAIDNEERRSGDAKETKVFRVGDMTPANSHLHTGGHSCAASFIIELQPPEWSAMAKKVVKTHVHGGDDGAHPGLARLIQALEERQHSWHASHSLGDAPEFCKSRSTEERPMCLMLAIEAKRLIGAMEFRSSASS